MDRDILAKIFEKLTVIDVTMGASRVCISWFLVSHQKSLWKTIDLAYLQLVDFNHPRLKNSQLDVKIIEGILYNPRDILTEITKLSSTVPTSLFFNFCFCVEDEDLIIAAERMPNIETFALPKWGKLSEDSYRFVFSQWKNLHTLIISLEFYLNKRIKFQLIGENCINLTNLKLSGYVDEHVAMKLVLYLPKLKRLSMRCSTIENIKIISFHITSGLQNLAILNLSHCCFIDSVTDPIFFGRVLEDSLIKTFTQKIDTFIMCSKVSCLVCKDQCGPGLTKIAFYKKHWRNDEIKELEF
ncbi:unnamed protein product [Microthlaspi erraticum]|uniref:F-box domain-containing protein n=1 Tax=Microthlaspi erraticum TaxID=1685480 RepID=A0A6D2I8C0_9BRAS|nr:unnamed protein product [Microthlaspi erraticum]